MDPIIVARTKAGHSGLSCYYIVVEKIMRGLEDGMGGLIDDDYLPTIQGQLNRRFGPGDPIEEMAGLQRAFGIFSREHPLREAAALLDIGPPDRKERRKWYDYLDSLREFESERSGVSGHDLIVAALEQNLKSHKPLPAYFEWHSMKEDPRVRARHPAKGPPLLFPGQDFLRISVPIKR